MTKDTRYPPVVVKRSIEKSAENHSIERIVGKGVAKWFSPRKGFGFLTPETGGQDVYVTQQCLFDSRVAAESFILGAPCEFVAHETNTGLRATIVMMVAQAPGAAKPPRRFVPAPPLDRELIASDAQGSIKWFNLDKGFGFILPKDGGKDVFVHASYVQPDDLLRLREDTLVIFDTVKGKKGPMAVNVRLQQVDSNVVYLHDQEKDQVR